MGRSCGKQDKSSKGSKGSKKDDKKKKKKGEEPEDDEASRRVEITFIKKRQKKKKVPAAEKSSLADSSDSSRPWYAAAVELSNAVLRGDADLPLDPVLKAMGAKPSPECLAFTARNLCAKIKHFARRRRNSPKF